MQLGVYGFVLEWAGQLLREHRLIQDHDGETMMMTAQSLCNHFDLCSIVSILTACIALNKCVMLVAPFWTAFSASAILLAE